MSQLPMNQLPWVLLHGWGMCARVWGSVPTAVFGEAAIHPLDLPGHGGAQLPADPGDLWAWTKLCLQQAPPQALWVGWSLGGSIALAAALLSPERIRGLLLVATTPRFIEAPDWPTAMPEATFMRFYQDLLAAPHKTLNRFLALQVYGSDEAPATLRRLKEALKPCPPMDPQALAVGLEILRQADLRGGLVKIRCPTLWVLGGRDALVPIGVAEQIAALQPQARIQVIAEAAHVPQLSHPEALGEAVRTFCQGLGP